MKKLLIFTLTYFYKFSQEITWKICIGESYLPQYRGLVFLWKQLLHNNAYKLHSVS